MALILIVDDDDQFRIMLRQIFELAGHHVTEASNGKECISAYQEKHADLVVTDIFMPEKEGIETIIELRRIFPDVKIIAMSGGGCINKDDCLLMARCLGAKKILTKPFSREKLLKTVSEIL